MTSGIPAHGEFGSDIPAGDGKLANLFLRCGVDPPPPKRPQLAFTFVIRILSTSLYNFLCPLLLYVCISMVVNNIKCFLFY
jgi:hypothetical protein